MAVATVTSLYGQGVVGQQVTCPWLTGASYEVTQGWGPTNVQSEPAEDRSGKHYSHWHAGVDLSSGSITTDRIVFPHGLGQQARVVYLDNPSGYGTALILQMFTQSYAGHAGGTSQVRNADIYLGHLATRLAKNGQVVREGDILAVPDSSGNSTGPHLHFEVRQPDGKYGTDADPSQWLLYGSAALGPGLNLNPFDALGSAITQAEQSVMNTVVGLAQTALGGTMMLAGGAAIGFGLRGMTPARAVGVTRRTARGLTRRRAEFDLTRQRRREVPQVSAAGRTRLRPTLRREVPQTAPRATGRMTAAEYETSLTGLSLERQRALSPQPRTRAEARGLIPMRHGVPIRGREATQLRRALPRKAA